MHIHHKDQNISTYLCLLLRHSCFNLNEMCQSQGFDHYPNTFLRLKKRKISAFFFLAWFFQFFSISFVYIPNDFPFPGSPLPLSPISPLPSVSCPINPLPLLCPGNPLQCCIKPFQDQGPLLPSSWESFDI